MRTEDLIADLASRAAPVRPLASPAIRLAAWSAVAVASALAGLAAFGLRSHVQDLLGQPSFLATAVASFGTAMLAGAAALVLAVPGAERSPALRRFAWALLAIWGSLMVAGVIRAGEGFSHDPHWPICVIRVIAIGLVPAWTLFGMLRRGAPLRLRSAGALAAIAAMAAAAGVIQFICPLDDPAHLLRGHFAPVLVMAVLSMPIAPRLLRSALSARRETIP